MDVNERRTPENLHAQAAYELAKAHRAVENARYNLKLAGTGRVGEQLDGVLSGLRQARESVLETPVR